MEHIFFSLLVTVVVVAVLLAGFLLQARFQIVGRARAAEAAVIAAAEAAVKAAAPATK